MEIRKTKDNIKEIIRRSSLKNYFFSVDPKHTGGNKSVKKKFDKISVFESQKLTLNLLVPPNRPSKLMPLPNEQDLKKKFIQLSSKQLEFPEITQNYRYKRSYVIKQLSDICIPCIENTVYKDASKARNLSLEQVSEYREKRKKLFREGRKEQGFIDIKKMNSADLREIHFNKLSLKKKNPKLVSIGENTEDCIINPWEIEKLPDNTFYKCQ